MNQNLYKTTGENKDMTKDIYIYFLESNFVGANRFFVDAGRYKAQTLMQANIKQ